VRPMHAEFVEPSKRFADVIIPEVGHNEVGILLPQSARFHRPAQWPVGVRAAPSRGAKSFTSDEVRVRDVSYKIATRFPVSRFRRHVFMQYSELRRIAFRTGEI
jgi:hypothetical protein